MACICALMRAPGEARRAGRPCAEPAARRPGREPDSGRALTRTVCLSVHGRGGGTSAGVGLSGPLVTRRGDKLRVRWVEWRSRDCLWAGKGWGYAS